MLAAAAEVLAKWDDPTDDECCVFVQAVIERAFKLAPADAKLTGLWRIFDVARPWSPVEAAVLAGVALGSPSLPPAKGSPTVGRWHVCQGWRGVPGAKGVTGHTFLWAEVAPGYGVCLDASDKRPPDRTLAGIRSWASRSAEFVGGVAIVPLRPLP
jgi:hypothetical protein